MNICLGMMAHNEERGIGDTLADVRRQDLWQMLDGEASLVVVVNGSTDRTAERARAALDGFAVPHRVVVLEQAGKANAWNQFVHSLAPAASELLILADADIRLPQPDTLRALVEALAAQPEVVAAVDHPVKDLVGGKGSRVRDRLSLSASVLAAAGPPKLCGQLYAARAGALRAIFLPEPMLVEDGFIKAMLVTDGFTRPENESRLVRAAGAYHVFEAETSLDSVYRHEKRILIGTLCNILLFEKARSLAGEGIAVGDWMRRQTGSDPDWFRRLIREHGRRVPWRRIGIMLPVPWRQLRQCRGAAAWKALPGALARTLLNLAVAAGAAGDLRRGHLRW